ncbi:hypothetical protein LCGC14_1758340, partial [marine sediment metagenome]
MFLILSRDEKYMFKILKNLALFFLAFLNVAVFAINVNFSDPTTTPAGSPDLASSGERAQITTDSSGRYVYAVWDDSPGAVQVAISSDFGENWNNPTSVPGGNITPNLAASGRSSQITTDSTGRYVYAVWDISGGAVQAAISSDFGVTWSDPTSVPGGNITPDLASSGELAQITTDSSGRYVYAVWDISGGGPVQVAISSDFGVTWADPTSTPAGSPDLASSAVRAQITTDSSGRYVYAVWEDFGGSGAVQVAISSDFGVTWVSPTTTPAGSPDLASTGERAQITTDSSGRYVYAVW